MTATMKRTLCVESILDQELGTCCDEFIYRWNPQLIGEKSNCLICGNKFKSVLVEEGIPDVISKFDISVTRDDLKSKNLLKDDHQFRKGTVIRKVRLDISVFKDREAALNWLSSHGLNVAKVVREDAGWMASQQPEDRFEKGTVRAYRICKGVTATIGVLKQDFRGDDGKPKAVSNEELLTDRVTKIIPQSNKIVLKRQGTPVLTGRLAVDGGHHHYIRIRLDGDTFEGESVSDQDHKHTLKGKFLEGDFLEVEVSSSLNPATGSVHSHDVERWQIVTDLGIVG